MLSKAFLIGKTDIDWTSFLGLSKQVLGRSVSRGLDNHNVKAEDLASFICALDEMITESNTLNSLNKAGSLLAHVHFIFLIVTDEDTLAEFIEESRLKVNSTESLQRNIRIAIVSGDLEEWRTAVINLSTGKESYSLRSLMNCIFELFKEQNLEQLWADYRKVQLDDNSSRLLSFIK